MFRKSRHTLFKWIRYLALSLVGAIVFIYLAFLGIMYATEAHWLEDAPFHESIDVRSSAPHALILIDEGMASFVERIRIIEAAEKTLELEFFIYDLDLASRIVSQKIAEKARQGVKVRVLVDFSLPVFKLRPGYAKLLEDAGVEVRYYNTASVARFFRVQHRTHRKILIADGEVAMIGGRNVADDYFDLSHHYNFLDSDMIIKGSAVEAIRTSFDLYWTSKWTVRPEVKTEELDPAFNDRFLEVSANDIATNDLINKFSKMYVSPKEHQCDDFSYITDYPGSGVNYRRVFPAIVKVMNEAENEVVAESPYFVIREDGAKVLRALTNKGVKLSIVTNSLASTDAYYTVGALFPSLNSLAMKNFSVYAYRGEPLKGYSGIANRSARWGVHAKRAVVDDDTVLIGTYNIDPRSANLNSELMVICRGNRELAAEMKTNINRHIQQSSLVIADAEVDHFALIEKADTMNLFMMIITMPVSVFFDFLL